MFALVRRYHAFLIRKAEEAKPNYVSKVQWYTAPWVFPAVVALLICWGFDITGTRSFWVTVPLGAVTLFGILYVAWVFMIYGIVADYRAAKRAK